MRTYIVLGVPRGGTSMVAGLLRIFGINMGDNIEPTKHEDLDLTDRPLDEIIDKIRKKNDRSENWGWKIPSIGMIIREVEPHLVNPCYIYISRDLVASMNSDLRHNLEFEKRDDAESFIWHRNMHLINEMDKILNRHNGPKLLLSYEESLKMPGELIDKMEEFTGIKLSPEKKEEAMKFISPGYKEIK